MRLRRRWCGELIRGASRVEISPGCAAFGSHGTLRRASARIPLAAVAVIVGIAAVGLATLFFVGSYL